MKKKKNLSKKAAAVAAVASAGVMMAGLFASPDELLQENDSVTPSSGYADLYAPDGGSGDDPDEDISPAAADEEEEEERRRGGFRARVRNAIRKAPVGVRAVVGVPLWALGQVLLWALSALWTGVLSPAAGTILQWVLTAALVLLGVGLVGKAAFPDLPLRKILSRRTVSGTLIALAVFGVADATLPFVWDGYDTVGDLIRLGASTAVFAAAAILFLRRESKKRQKASGLSDPEAAKPVSLTQKEALREVLALADSVK